MNTFPFRITKKYFPQIILALSLLGIYLRTLAPDLSWANSGTDGGDLIAAAATGGIPHPTGYPLYLLLARLFQFLPLGSLAFRTNLMSAVASVLTAILVYAIVSQATSSSGAIPSRSAGMLAGYACGLAPLMWSQAVITEVYTLQGFLVALIIYLGMQPDPVSIRARKYLDGCRGLVLGLSLGNHITTILLIPAALLVGSIYKQFYGHGDVQNRRGWFGKWRCDGFVLRRRLSWFGAGLLIYVVLPLRAMAHPPVNWGNPITLRNLWWLVSGQLYKSYYLNISLSGIWEHLQVAAEFLLAQFGEIGTMLGLLGLIVFGTGSRLYVLTTWAAASSLAFAVIYGSVDFYIYLIPMILAFAVWIGLGIAGLTHQLSNRQPVFGLGLILLICGYLVVRTLTQLSQVDASDDRRAESFGHEVLATAPQDAIIFAKGDQAVFTLWYYHFALGERPDLTVLAEDLLHFDWYQENLHMLYPSIVISGPFPYPEAIIRANPTNAVCNVLYLESPEVLCSKPLHFP